MLWKGNQKMHRGANSNPPPAYGIDAFSQLQRTLDEHLVQGRGDVRMVTRKLEGRMLGGAEHWTASAQSVWETVLVTMLPSPDPKNGAPPGKNFALLNHEFVGDSFPYGHGNAKSRTHEDWVLQRLRTLGDAGSVNLGDTVSGPPPPSPASKAPPPPATAAGPKRSAVDIVSGSKGKLSTKDRKVITKELENATKAKESFGDRRFRG